jgi:hypothetical protein
LRIEIFAKPPKGGFVLFSVLSGLGPRQMPLTTSDRVTLIKEIAIRLGNEFGPAIDMTLSEFSLPTKASWDNDSTSYVMAMTKGAPESV